MGHIGIGGSPKSGGGSGASNVTVDYVKGYVNSSNSSTTPLAANAVFTGSAMDVTDFAVINVNVYSDKASATNGVKVEFSPDGVNWDHSHSTTYTAGSGRGYIFNAEYKYARVVYTNDGADQTVFRLQTVLKPTRVQSSLLRLDQNPTDYFFAELTKSVIQGKTTGGGGGYVDVKVTPSGSLTVALGDITEVEGQAPMANSLPVAIASDQSSVPITDSQTTFDHGAKSSIGTSAVQITSTSIAAKKGVTVKAANNNSGIIYVGNSDVTAGTTDATDGFELANGESIFLEVDNANKVYVIGSAAGQKAYWTVV